VTSSNCVAGNASAGSGIGPDQLHYILGITISPHVGSGPFPTELPIDEPGTIGHHLSTVGQERGTVTGRARRCGWLDAALLKRSILINGISGLCIPKLDVLDGLAAIKVCVGYSCAANASTSHRSTPTISSPACRSTKPSPAGRAPSASPSAAPPVNARRY
jgi:adenylosuccinate synthase